MEIKTLEELMEQDLPPPCAIHCSCRLFLLERLKIAQWRLEEILYGEDKEDVY